MFAALVVFNIAETPRWFTEYVAFKSQRHAQRFLDAIALDDLPEGDILGSTPIYPPDGQPLDPLLSRADRPFTSQSETEAVAIAEAVRKNPPKDFGWFLSHSTPIYVVNPQTKCVKAVRAEQKGDRSMNKDIVVTLDRTHYRWIYEPQAAVSSSWTWRNEQTNMVPTPQIESRLNRYLLDHNAASFRDTWGKDDLPRFHAVLHSLGASRDDIIKFDRGSCPDANPDGVSSGDTPKKTAKATSRKRLKKPDK